MQATPPLPQSSSSSSSLELIEQLKSQVSEPLWAAVNSKLQQLALAELKIQVLEEQLRRRLIAKYGPGSERNSLFSDSSWLACITEALTSAF